METHLDYVNKHLHHECDVSITEMNLSWFYTEFIFHKPNYIPTTKLTVLSRLHSHGREKLGRHPHTCDALQHFTFCSVSDVVFVCCGATSKCQRDLYPLLTDSLLCAEHMLT